MGLEREAAGKKLRDPAGTSLEIEDAIASPAVEVVVVMRRDRRELVAGGLPGNLDGPDLARLLEGTKRAVDRAQSEARLLAGSVLVELVRREGATLAGDDREQERPLLRAAAERAARRVGGRRPGGRRGCALSRGGHAATICECVVNSKRGRGGRSDTVRT